MALSCEKKKKIVETFEKKPGDTGCPEVQIALCTARIFEISEHLKHHKKDVHSRRGLEGQRSARRSLLDYLKREDEERYKAILSALELRR
ncbi:30S ribosomal protein S15 [Holospora curviuscula]|uniref:Small ribosomal subunit protein uS15 n=1 Tax=Holospora curviuscula TaxID=1082868 RepID=A0A2S5R837_9PROT|nr:30S ribosomal protein S15 [Holospora curviuscula]PPE03496.1 30S ribosomal protein S15 [Holospora curviuscula]